MAEKLTLDDFAPDRPVVAYEGKTYHIKARADMSLSDLGWFKRNSPRANELFNSFQDDDVSDEEIDELEGLIDTLIQRISFDIPEDVQEEFTLEQKMKLLDFFSSSIPTEKKPKKKKRTGAK